MVTEKAKFKANIARGAQKIKRGKPAGMSETEYLLSNPENKRVLLKSLKEAEEGLVEEFKPDEW